MAVIAVITITAGYSATVHMVGPQAVTVVASYASNFLKSVSSI
jgi:hypothetical protein